MGELELPWLEPGSTADEAVDRLIEANRKGGTARAIATRRNGKPVLITAETLVEAAQTAVGRRLSRLEAIADTMPLPKRFTTMAADEMETLLDEKGASFAINLASPRRVQVITRHEGLQARFGAAAAICRCTGPRRHPWFAEQLASRKCKICGSPVVCK